MAPESRVVYVDHDRIVLRHAQALMTSTPAGRAEFLMADIHEPEAVLAVPALRETLDMEQPVALMLRF